MPGGPAVPPGRAGRLWLVHRLAVAGRGADLLRRKLVLLRAERDRLRAEAEAAAAGWREAARRADLQGERAALLAGTPALTAAAPAGRADVTAVPVTLMALRYPGAVRCVLPAPDPDRPLTGSAAVVEAERAYRDALPAAARRAAALAALRAVEAELASTGQRVRAIERHWIPRLRDALARVELDLEESERADAITRQLLTSPGPAAG